MTTTLPVPVPSAPVETYDDRELAAALAVTLNGHRHESRLIREMSNRVGRVLREKTRGLPDPDSAYNAALYELTTRRSMLYFSTQWTGSLVTYAGRVASGDRVQRVGRVGVRDAARVAGSLDVLAASGAEPGEWDSYEAAEAGRVEEVRWRFEAITMSVLTRQERRAIIEYANLHRGAPPFLEKQTVVAGRMHVTPARVSELIGSAQRKISQVDEFIGGALRALCGLDDWGLAA